MPVILREFRIDSITQFGIICMEVTGEEVSSRRTEGPQLAAPMHEGMQGLWDFWNVTLSSTCPIRRQK